MDLLQQHHSTNAESSGAQINQVLSSTHSDSILDGLAQSLVLDSLSPPSLSSLLPPSSSSSSSSSSLLSQAFSTNNNHQLDLDNNYEEDDPDKTNQDQVEVEDDDEDEYEDKEEEINNQDHNQLLPSFTSSNLMFAFSDMSLAPSPCSLTQEATHLMNQGDKGVNCRVGSCGCCCGGDCGDCGGGNCDGSFNPAGASVDYDNRTSPKHGIA